MSSLGSLLPIFGVVVAAIVVGWMLARGDDAAARRARAARQAQSVPRDRAVQPHPPRVLPSSNDVIVAEQRQPPGSTN